LTAVKKCGILKIKRREIRTMTKQMAGKDKLAYEITMLQLILEDTLSSLICMGGSPQAALTDLKKISERLEIIQSVPNYWELPATLKKVAND
jgi:hypothetical protein